MKKLIKQTRALLVLIAFSSLFTSCKKSDDKSSSNSSSGTSAVVVTGTWRVSYYHESGDDKTTNFSGYVFTFNANGTMTASNGTPVSGTWSADDSHNEFHMSIGSSSPCNDISNGWTILTQTSTELDLRDDNS